MKKSLIGILLIISLSLLIMSNYLKTENKVYESPNKTSSFKISETIGTATTIHNFQDLVMINSGPDYNYSLRNVAIGYPHPDGKLRIAFGSAQIVSRLSIFKQDASTFDFVKEIEYFYSWDQWAFSYAVLMYDFTGDGLDEILFTSYGWPTSGYNTKILSWNGTGYSFIKETEAGMITLDNSAQIHDIDRDGKPELITQTISKTYIYSWESGFTDFSLDATLTGGASMDVGIGDIDNDGEDEIITCNTGNGRELYIYGYNDGKYAQEYQGNFVNKGYSALAVVDIDDDGENELIGASPNWSLPSYAIIKFEWDGTKLLAENITTTTFGFFDVKAGDIDGDGYPEVMTQSNGGGLFVIEQAQNGSIVFQQYGLSIDIWFELFDMDGDAILEIIVSPGGYSNREIVYRDDVHGPPALINISPSSITIEQNSNVNYNVSWTPIDRQNLTYFLYWEGTEFYGPITWLSDKPIKYNLYSRTGSIGTFNLTLVVFDSDLNKVKNSVFITVISPDPPTISKVESFPSDSGSRNMTVSADITDISGIFSAILYYQVDSGTWTNVDLKWLFGDTYQAEIGSFLLSQEIKYYIIATDDTPDHNTAIADNSGAYYSFKIVDNLAPTISNVNQIPSDPVAGESISIYVDIEDESGISSAYIYIQTNGGGWTSIVMDFQSGVTYHVNIGIFPENTLIEYYFTASDASEFKNEATNDNKGNYYSIHISSTPESSTDQTTTTEDTSEETIRTESSEDGAITLNTPIILTGFEIVLFSLGAIFYRKYKNRK